jgi:ABC-type cobalamin/Fe3+-siderophores transport system ATPase subunit
MGKIKSIHLQRFRQFADTKLEVGPFNLLVGPNNCGKTTVLHAIRSVFLLMHGHVRFEGTPPQAVYHRRFLPGADEIAPTPDIKELWYNQKTGKPITISLTFDDETTFGISLRLQFGQLHVSAENLPPELTPTTVASYLGTDVAFIPGLVGVLVTEPYATPARRNALATQGRYSEIFRSSLRQLKSKDVGLLSQINSSLSALFGTNLSTVEFNDESDEFVTVKYREKDADFDVVSSGAGLQQVIQMLTYLYISKPKVLLIDEPDAHLHSKLQARLGDLFRRVAQDLDAQVFLSTHSLDLIDTFSTNEVIVVDSSRKQLAPVGKNADLVSALVDANVVDVSALSRLLSSRRLVVVEDKDQTVLKALDKTCGSPLFSSKSSSYVLSARGVSNFRAVAQLGRVLASLAGTKFDITFVQDRDGMPEFLVEPFLASQQEEGVTAHLLERHEIENYLLQPALFAKAASLVGRTLSQEEAETAILAAAQELKAEARRSSLECAKLINRHLNRDRIKDDDLEIKVFKWFDELKLDDLNTVQCVFPGKELLPEALKILNNRVGKPITRGSLVASLEANFVPQDMINFLTNAAEPKTQKK